MDPYNNFPKYSTSLDDCPIIRSHWPDADFAQATAHDALGKHWVPPEDRDFTDRPPPGALAAAKPKQPTSLDVVATLCVKRSAT